MRRFPHAPLKRAQWTGIPTGVAGAVLSALNIGSVAARLAPLRIPSVLWSAVRWIFRDPILLLPQGAGRVHRNRIYRSAIAWRCSG